MGRKRRHEEVEPVVVSSDEVESVDEDDKQQSERKKHHRSKKSKKEKRSHKSRSKHSKKHRNRSKSETPDEEETELKQRKKVPASHNDDDDTADDDASTDQEGGQTPVRNDTTRGESDVEDGEISEEEKGRSSKESTNRREFNSPNNTHTRNRDSDKEEEDEESRDEDTGIENKGRREETSFRKRRDRTPQRERNESNHRREKSSRRKTHRRASTDEDEKMKDRRYDDDYRNGHRRAPMEEDEALAGDVPFNAKKADPEKEREGLISGKEESVSSTKEASLSIDETNKLRAKLGLKPLNITGKESVTSKKKKDEVDNKTTDKQFSHLEVIAGTEFRHNPAENLTEKVTADKLREKLKRKRAKRKQESKLLAVKSLADSSDEDAGSWVLSQKQKQEEKERAKKRAQMFEELDDDFGIGNLIEADKKESKKKEHNYDSKALTGLKVEHSYDRFQEGKNMILTLKDSQILDEKAMDTLENVNVVDQEKAEKNIIDIKKAKQAYNKFDVEDVDDVTGDIEKKDILYKYDEEIDGVKKKSFVIGKNGNYNQDEADRRRREDIRNKLHGNKEMFSLNTGTLRLASDYMTQEEFAATKFKKIKKKKKVKTKILKADDLIDQLEHEKHRGETGHVDPYQDVEMETMPPPSMPTKDDDDTSKLTAALQRTRNRLKNLKKSSVEEDVAERVLKMTKIQASDNPEYDNTGAEFIGTFADDTTTNSNIILNETSEFCRHLGAWRASEASGMTESVPKEILDFEDSLKVDSTKEFEKNNEMKEKRGQWEEVTEDNGIVPMDLDGDAFGDPSNRHKGNTADSTILDEEPDMAVGIAAALQVARNKGYLGIQEKEQKSGNIASLLAKNYTIDDKAREREDEGGRRGGRDRNHDRGGPSMPFQEKSAYIPNVKLEYVDDNGRLMNEKEAFRHLSHKFHGKGSGKIKTEKRMKKVMEESMMKNMSSTDTPLGTLHKLKERQKESATPYVVLTGNREQYEQIKK